MAVQIAKAVGATVIAIASSKEKLDIAKRFGADEDVNYTRNLEWFKEVLELTGGNGVDVVYDLVRLVDKRLKCLKPRGHILIFGFTGIEGDMEKIVMNRILLRQAQLIGYPWKGLEEMWETGAIKPTVFGHDFHGLESVVPAMKALSERKV
ncbi:hypothetical protein G7Y89_g7454 [Cudoniella acicularis]|uniref:Alcohol dehydrogenase-like C-terminal domain-containing protein n=1 Tax=Cudoniella acicularis TaxID=354080 RepID=A0A8H4RIH9_9HELO|nr:hypothetical protein G7Y89_g7454 [Cudoniella acicularis]